MSGKHMVSVQLTSYHYILHSRPLLLHFGNFPSSYTVSLVEREDNGLGNHNSECIAMVTG